MPEPMPVVDAIWAGVPPAQLHPGTVVLVVVLVALVVVVESGIVIVGVIDVLVVVVVVVVELVVEVVVVEVVVVVVTVVVVVGTVVVVVVTVVVVVGTVVVVVVVTPAHESAVHFPGPMLTPPWAAHLFAERSAHTLPWQQRFCAASARGTGPASTGTIADMKMKPRTLRLIIACIIGVLPAPRSGGIRDRRFVAPRLLSALLATSARSATGGSANRRSAPEVRLAIPSAWEA